jgi:hypothetical protein
LQANRLGLDQAKDEAAFQKFFESFQPYENLDDLKIAIKVYSDVISAASPENANDFFSFVYAVREQYYIYRVFIIFPFTFSYLYKPQKP